MIDLNLFSDPSRNVAMATNFMAQLANQLLVGTLCMIANNEIMMTMPQMDWISVLRY